MQASNPYFHETRFRDHDELSSLIHGGTAEFFQRAPGAFKGRFALVTLESGSVQFGQVELPYLSSGSPAADRTAFILHLKPQRGYVWKGRAVQPGAIMVLPPRSEHQDISPSRSSWAILDFHRTPLERALSDLNGAEYPLNLQGNSRLILPEPGSFETLRRRLEAVQAAVERDPSILEVPEARQGIDESILSALALAVGSASLLRPHHYGAAARARVVRQVEAYLLASSGKSVSLAELCAVAGVGERTLRNLFQERFGMSPVRYLKMRRLHQIRRALRRADPEFNTVRSIAHRCGAWHLGRFANEYRTLFNESPLETLRKTRLIGETRGNQE